MLEETPKGTAIGIPVTATDADSADELTYWLSGNGDDADKFDIDARTGQLKVETKLNYEADADETGNQCATPYNACSVTVFVADSSGRYHTGFNENVRGDGH